MNENIEKALQAGIELKQKVLTNSQLLILVEEVVSVIVNCYKAGGKVLLCGNGGSAADAQHIAAELSGRYYFDRPPLYAEALHVNTSFITAVGNDYGYDHIFSRMVKAAGKPGDILIGFSTSGNSANILQAFDAALELKMTTIGFTGLTGGKLKEKCCYLFAIPSTDTPRIQELHIALGHIICELIEKQMFGK